MRVATFTSSGKTIEYTDGLFMADAARVSAQQVLDYDRLGTLTWVSDDVKQWVCSLVPAQAGDGMQAPPDASPPRPEGTSSSKSTPKVGLPVHAGPAAPPDPIKRWMERHERLVALAWLAAVIVLIAIGWSTLRGHRAIVTNVYPSLGVAEIRDTSDGELYMAEPVSGLTVWAGDEVRYESWTDEMKRITSVTEPAQAR